MIRTVFTLLLPLLLLFACVEEDDEGPVIGANQVDSARAACEAGGGRFGAGGLPNTQVCYTPFPDANEPCESADDCQGFCLARSRSCSPVEPVFGCIETLTSRGAESTVCFE
ncbi:MAG: hypothetical protein AAGF74_04970 [Pseudomonadota bacterium]